MRAGELVCGCVVDSRVRRVIGRCGQLQIVGGSKHALLLDSETRDVTLYTLFLDLHKTISSPRWVLKASQRSSLNTPPRPFLYAENHYSFLEIP